MFSVHTGTSSHHMWVRGEGLHTNQKYNNKLAVKGLIKLIWFFFLDWQVILFSIFLLVNILVILICIIVILLIS